MRHLQPPYTYHNKGILRRWTVFGAKTKSIRRVGELHRGDVSCQLEKSRERGPPLTKENHGESYKDHKNMVISDHLEET